MKNKRLTSKDVQKIVKLYPNMKSEKIAKMFNVKVYCIYRTAQRYGIKKSKEFLNSPDSGRMEKGKSLSPGTQFRKGHVPKTKGKKWSDFMKSEESINNSRRHLWKKGNKPHTTKEDGTITDRMLRNGVRYKFIRISEGDWMFLHRHIWEEHHGEIPDGFNVVFKDGNPMNCVISNLECISNAELAERNRHTKYPLEIRTAIEAINKLNKRIKEYEKD